MHAAHVSGFVFIRSADYACPGELSSLASAIEYHYAPGGGANCEFLLARAKKWNRGQNIDRHIDANRAAGRIVRDSML